MTNAEYTIVLARLVDTMTPTLRDDLGRLTQTGHSTHTAEALVWLLVGTDEDVASAKAFAARSGYRVFLYPISESDPLGCARRDVRDPEKGV